MTVINALASGKPDDLLGLPETSWLDFKSSPYPIKTDKGKYELCKDVAAFANAQGGLLVLGISTRKLDDQALEVADKRHPFPQSAADLNTWIDVLNEHLRPRVVVSHSWYPDPDSPDHYLVLDVEPVAESARYVIVRRMINDRDKLAEGVVIPQRHGDRTVYLPPDDVYGLINEGLRARAWPQETAQIIPVADLALLAEESINEMEQMQDWADVPVLYLQSIPTGRAGLLREMFGGNGVQGALSHQDVLRRDGFNLADRTGRLRVLGGGLYLDQTRYALWVRPNGLITAGLPATSDLLGWAMEQYSRRERINPWVLTEMTLEYFRIADDLIKPRVTGAVEHRIVARRFRGDEPRLLGAANFPLHMMISDAQPASADTLDLSWPAVGDPERDAYEALLRVYGLFGLDVGINRDVEDDRVPMSRFRERD
ncbi:ATP-binding protein [Catellatospora sp. KI3]|uniref:AlbA family DNA-binding domain-containing protein n=1 Tax=Catellatospora sp. KI3 TaxID=3041620 RepID=UPI0024832C2D|nr:ATP-binding protein [Catellatospora sp. KI3]MDI1466291.1 ATP-binding protein [Catellatospora sp. KI3]